MLISKFSKLNIALLCLLITGVYFAAAFFGNAQKCFELKGFTDTEYNVSPFLVMQGGQQIGIDKLPVLLDTDECVSLYYKFDGIDFSLSPVRQVLCFYTDYNSVEIYAGEEKIYEYPDAATQNGFNGFVPSAGHIVSIGNERLGETIEVRLIPSADYGHVMISPCQISTKSQVLWSMLKKDAISILIDSLLFLLGVILVLAFFIAGRGSGGLSIVYLGLFLMGYSSLNALMLDLVASAFANKMTVSILSVISLILTINAWVFFVFYTNSKRNVRAFRFVTALNAAAVIISAGVCWALQINPRRYAIAILLAGGIAALCSAAVLIKDYLAYRDIGIGVVFGVCLLTLIAFWDILMYNLGRQFALGLFGGGSVLLFVILWAVNISRGIDEFFYAKTQLNALETVAYQDSLTGCKNRRAFDYKMNEYMRCFAKEEINLENIAMMMFDSDNLKQINDNYSHAHGDRLIVATAKAVEKFFGELGDIYRTGGDEFVLICENADIKLLEATAKSFDCEVNEKRTYGIGVSWGLAQFDINRDDSLNALLSRAERYMYDEKRQHKAAI